MALLLASCAGPGGSGGLQHDKWGHRPGPKGFHTVIIDAGHGGKDSGAISRSTGAQEKDLALDTAQRLQRQLSGKVKVVMMRKGDSFIELDDRASRASGKDGTVLISIHYNSSSSGIRGPETCYWRVDSHGLATRVQRAMESVSPAESGNRGKVRRRLRLTRNPDVPCILAEPGYLSHPAEARLCSDPAYRERMASALARAILDQQANGDAGSLPKPIYAPPSRPTDPPGS
ncbi:MAG: hypothetical protein B9S38_03245 [Verrucomicrobiia bacterium Tous-C4TDCM]|nr:MAG: hypothetical protein B9S38_03245 [Verrucomicrobiae bacterium Tous-C4TDCM]